ncbi:MAG: class I SAM-dependent methyltransferase [Sedimentisphaerales bacterium]|nr:class I SAM-dependent methyltransferase [Sedimentisphaerales bacterium]
MKEMQMPQGLVRISDYKALLQSELFSRMEKFSNNFITQNSEILTAYSRKWVLDPLHQWSRQWEYCFVFSHIQKYATTHQGEPIKILDAGSGITFFPYFLRENIQESVLTCCDVDTSLQKIFGDINTRTKSAVRFLHKDIRNTGLESNSLAVIYSISVLEHTANYDEIVKEFARLLRDDGILIVTFDISLDGYSDIPVSQVKKIIASLQNHLSPIDEDSILRLLDGKELFGPDIITTSFVSNWNKSLLPWKYPLLSSLLASFKKQRFPHFGIKKLTFTCHIFKKI